MMNNLKQLEIDKKLETAFAYHEKGCFSEAENLYRQIVHSQPDNFDALRLWAMILRSKGEPAEAVKLFSKAVKINSLHPGTLNNFGNAYTDLGQYQQAISCYQRALKLHANYAEAFNNLGYAQLKLQQPKQALCNFEQAVRIKPDYLQSWQQKATAEMELGLYQQLIESIDKILSLKPNDAEAFNLRGNALILLNRDEEAITCFKRALYLSPANVAVLTNLGNINYTRRNFTQALAYLDGALAIDANLPETLNCRGLVLQSIYRYDDAIDCFLSALAISANFAAALTNLGIVYMELNRATEAEQCFQRSLNINPTCVRTLYNQSLLTENKLGKTGFEKLLKINRNARSLLAEEKYLIHFGLGRHYHQAGDFDSAFKHFAEGCRIKRETINYSRQHMTEHVDSIIQAFNSECFHTLKNTYYSNQQPIFILGMPRSGTTLIEQILSSHLQVSAGGEVAELLNISKLGIGMLNQAISTTQLKASNIQAWAAAYHEVLARLNLTATHITDKTNDHFLAVGLINLLFPSAKIIHVRRNPVDTCLSCFVTAFRDSHDYSYDLLDLAHYYLEYDRLMRHWHTLLPAQNLLEIHYEELITDQQGITGKLLEHCQLNWDDACINFYQNNRPVRTASTLQVRHPLYNSSVERWREYEKHLVPLLEVLSPVLKS
ncbi:sulfotransferase [Methylomonas sp. AM2-LC]|uniref:tetratricopeptide repeat-containing sulfotransferase family protein n=1 Tax=Methylomonas sp. AM2-LC TaxID=3153301 RepID=UPI003264BEC0